MPTASKKTTKKNATGFSDFERQAMKERAKELAAEARSKNKREQGEKDVLAAIAKMVPVDRAMAKKIHEIVKKTAPELSPKTWYGMPAYAKEDKVVCFVQETVKFESRYVTLGFTDKANLDEGNMWPASFALKKLTAAEEKKITALVKKAIREK